MLIDHTEIKKKHKMQCISLEHVKQHDILFSL